MQHPGRFQFINNHSIRVTWDLFGTRPGFRWVQVKFKGNIKGFHSFGRLEETLKLSYLCSFTSSFDALIKVLIFELF